jgi:hypothetical protein
MTEGLEKLTMFMKECEEKETKRHEDMLSLLEDQFEELKEQDQDEAETGQYLKTLFYKLVAISLIIFY